MESVDLEIWWSSLPVSEKERIAKKGIAKNGGNPEDAVYPACTSWWNALEASRKASIYNHCVVAHGDELKEWREENPYGD